MRWGAFLPATLLLACTIDVRQVPAPRNSEAPASLSKHALYLGNIDVYSAEREHLAEAWKATLASVIRSHRVFRTVQFLPKTKEELKEPYSILDMEVRPKLEDGYNWWVTWPGIYPMSGYWPLQIRTAKYNLELHYRVVDENGQEVLKETVTQEAEHRIFFYGFFRTSAFEGMIETANLEAMESCAKKLEAQFSSP